jgi:hypothetical protein
MRRVFVKPPGFQRFCIVDRDTSTEPPERAPRPKAGLAEAAWAQMFQLSKSDVLDLRDDRDDKHV